MRTYSSFLLFEEVLDFAPTDNGDLFLFVQRVIKPRVLVIEENCFTKIGKNVEVNYEIEGLVELATDTVINKVRIDSLLAGGIYRVAVRNLHSCITDTGICRRCYGGTYIDQVAPSVTSYVNLETEYNYQTDVFKGDSVKTAFELSEKAIDYNKLLIIVDGIIQVSGYTVTNDILEMAVSPIIGTNVVAKFIKITAQPFMGYLSQTYSGSLMGLKSLPTQTINIRPSLAQSLFTDQELEAARQTLATNYKTVTRNYIEYIDTIQNKLEKAIYISVLYGLYSNVTT